MKESYNLIKYKFDMGVYSLEKNDRISRRKSN